ncbi:hypothetical protein VTJ04DRAFT_8003 [Mycothermus thermophilus]|uniref:uncharacterized protein n=1 Tax=Humicola insolens TaxID=85995 RepID=UPI003742DBDD
MLEQDEVVDEDQGLKDQTSTTKEALFQIVSSFLVLVFLSPNFVSFHPYIPGQPPSLTVHVDASLVLLFCFLILVVADLAPFTVISPYCRLLISPRHISTILSTHNTHIHTHALHGLVRARVRVPHSCRRFDSRSTVFPDLEAFSLP